MSAILIILVFLFIVVVLAVTTRQRNAPPDDLSALPPQVPRNLFAPPSAQAVAVMDAEKLRTDLLMRATQEDFSALTEAITDKILYHEILTELATRDLHGIAAYIARQKELRTTAPFAEAIITAWRQAPTRHGLAQMLYLAALSDDAEIYFLAVATAVQAWRARQLSHLLAPELSAAIETHYWLLAPVARETNLALKSYLAQVRRELNHAAML